MPYNGLVDADIIAYRSALKAESAGMDVLDLEDMVNATCLDWTVRCDCFLSLFFLSSGRSFRHALCDTYKANRRPKPDLLEAARFFIQQNHKTVMWDGFEADDLIGIHATSNISHLRYPPVIITIDKDLKQIPGLHWNPDKDSEVRTISHTQAQRNFCFQWLTGDTTDGYKGIPGIGPKKADKILGDTDCWFEMYAKVIAAYKKANLDMDYCLLQGRLAFILQYPWVDWKDRTPIPWSPLVNPDLFPELIDGTEGTADE